MVRISRDWSFVKSLIDSNAPWTYEEHSDKYIIYVRKGFVAYEAFISKDGGTDHTNFDASYKANALGTLSDVTMAVDGSGNAANIVLSGDRVKTETTIVDPTVASQKAKVDVSGRLQVSTQNPTPPPAATSVVQTSDGDMGNNATSNIFYTIPNSTTLTIQRLLASGEGGAQNGWFFELYEDPNGVGTSTSAVQGSWVLISLLIIQENGGSAFFDTGSQTYSGNGTRRIVLRRVRRGGGGTKRGFIQFTGFIV